MSHLFSKCDRVEVIKRQNGPSSYTYYPTTVLRLQKNKILVEYHTLMVQSDVPQRITELIHPDRLRPMYQNQPDECHFKVNDAVDVYCDNGWHKGSIRDVLVDSRYVVSFCGISEGVLATQSDLRVHRQWTDGSWVPPFLPQKNDCPVKVNPVKLRVKFKCRTAAPKEVALLKTGDLVEVRTDEEGYQGAWYSGIIVGFRGNNRVMVKYANLLTDDETDQLVEMVSLEHVRPKPPPVELVAPFKLSQKVDVRYNEGWWEGVVERLVSGFRYVVYFSTTDESLQFEHSELRPHQDWIEGKWVQEKATDSVTNVRDQVEKFSQGAKVEVKIDEDGFQGAWYAATIAKVMGIDKYLVQYNNLLTDDETEFLIEPATACDMRPSPPCIQHVGPYELLEVVDAWHNSGWWSGRVTRAIKVQESLRYTVQFKTKEDLEFPHCELRPHLEWIDGQWATVSKDWEP